MGIPYASATSTRSQDEVKKMLRQAGCEAVVFFEDFEQHQVLLQFSRQGHKFQLAFSPKDWAAMSLRDKPWTS